MSQYIVRRILLMIPTLIGVSLLVTGFTRMLPGDAVDILVSQGEVQGGSAAFKELVDKRLAQEGLDPVRASFGDRARIETGIVEAALRERGIDPASATDTDRQSVRNAAALEAYKDTLRSRIGLDKNYLQQWFSWITDALRGDLGVSLQGGRPVGDEMKRRIPVSLELGILAMGVSLLIALPTGIISAVRQDSWLDYISRSSAIAMLALPSFFLATLVIAIAARFWDYSFPIFYKQLWDSPRQNLELVLVPAIILGIGLSGTLMRLTRAQMLEVLRQDYIRTARAKGLASRSVVMRHAMRNALLPVVTVIGLQVPILIGGSLVLEQIFGIPGVAQYLFVAIAGRDFPAIIAVNMVVAVAIVAVNLIVDLTYAVLDPRVSLA